MSAEPETEPLSAEPEGEPEPIGEPEPWPETEPEAELFNGSGKPELGVEPGAEPEPGFSQDVVIVFVVLAVLIIIIGTIGNVTVVIVITRMKLERTLTEIFMTSLAIADLLVCIIAAPLLVVGVIEHQGHTGISYQVEQFLFYFSSVASILNLTAIAIDRYDAVLHPMSRTLSKNNIKWALLGIWNIAFAAALVIHFIPSRFELIVLAPFFSIPCAVMIVCYYRILKTAKQSEEKALKKKFEGKDIKTTKSESKTDRTVRMVIFVVVVFIVSWIPSIISRLVKYVAECSAAAIASMEVAACLIAYAGSALNFVVYACMSRRFQIGLMQLLGCHTNKVGCSDTTNGDIGKTVVETQSSANKQQDDIPQTKQADVL